MIGLTILVGIAAGIGGIFVGKRVTSAELTTKLALVKSSVAKFEVAAETDARKILAEIKARL